MHLPLQASCPGPSLPTYAKGEHRTLHVQTYIMARRALQHIDAVCLGCCVQECHIEMSEAQLNGLLEKEGVTPDRKLGVPIMHAETFKRIMLHVRASCPFDLQTLPAIV